MSYDRGNLPNDRRTTVNNFYLHYFFPFFVLREHRTRRMVGGLVVYLLLLIQAPLAMAGPTYYVDGANGDDAYSDLMAQNPATPWRTIKKAVDTGGLINITKKNAPLDGYTVVVQPGVYNESVESKRDGLPDNPVILRAASPGTVTIQPPPGTPGFFISHHHHVVDGFVVTGAGIGLKLGPHDGGDGPTSGLVARNNTVHSNSNNGIQFSNAVDGVAEFNTVSQNGQNGISYSGNGSMIHDNTATMNGQFGIYVKDGVDHRVWSNTASNNTKGNIKILGSTLPPPVGQPPGQRTFYVSETSGNDTYDELKAQNPATPWKTIKRGLQSAIAGETVAILPGLYAVNVGSLRDGAPDAPITLQAVTPGSVIIQPPSGSGVYIGHNYHVISGLVITGAGSGLQLGPYKAAENPPVTGLVARNNVLYGNLIGIKFTNAIDSTAMHNEIYNNRRDGIWYSGSGANIFNNLVYANGQDLTGQYGITLRSGDRHQVTNNTVYGNLNGGIRLGLTASLPVFATVLNNIVVNNLIGIKEPGGSDYTGHATVDYNLVYGNTKDYDLSNGSGTVKGPHSISLPPVFVDAANGDFRLGRRDTGQPTDSPAINKGSDTAEALNLGGRTAFTDKHPDVGVVDLGYHGTVLKLAEGATTISQATLSFDLSSQSLTLAANLRPGTDSDGIEPGNEFVEVVFGGFQFYIPAAGFQQVGSQWVYNGGGSVSGATIEELGDGSQNITLQVTDLALEAKISTTTSISLQIGDDFGSAPVSFRGTLTYP
jgi:parallel beta-helix repeat protein